MLRASWALVIGALTGCAAPLPHGPVAGGAVPETTFVIAQVCLRAEFDRSSIGVQTVKPGSVSGGAQRLTGRTSADQPVFEFSTAHPRELRTVLVALPQPGRYTTEHFVFDPPAHIEFDRWSDWLQASAVAVNGNWGVGTGMVNGVKPAVKPLPPASPMVRYRLMSFQQYLDGIGERKKNGLDANLTPC